MLKRYFVLIASFVALSTFAGAVAAAGDAMAGKEKTLVCATCHAVDGNSVIPEFPKLAGQVPGYIARQLKAYQSGARQSAVMMGMINSLSEQDILDIDAYYAQFEGTPHAIQESELASAKRGEEIYRQGVSQFSIPACMACHGPAGHGIPSRYPKVSGQYKRYLVQSLQEFKSGVRVNEEMNTIAFRLSQEQIEDLATYMQGLN